MLATNACNFRRHSTIGFTGALDNICDSTWSNAPCFKSASPLKMCTKLCIETGQSREAKPKVKQRNGTHYPSVFKIKHSAMVVYRITVLTKPVVSGQKSSSHHGCLIDSTDRFYTDDVRKVGDFCWRLLWSGRWVICLATLKIPDFFLFLVSKSCVVKDKILHFWSPPNVFVYAFSRHFYPKRLTMCYEGIQMIQNHVIDLPGQGRIYFKSIFKRNCF